MVSDSIINASIPNASKDFGKKKRTNRSAKLKQCKLDARREQWLSQGKNKGSKDGVNGGELNGSMASETSKKAPRFKGLEVINPSVEVYHESDPESSPANSPTSSISEGNDSGNNDVGSSSSSSSSSSFRSGGCCSGNITEEEEGGDNGFGGNDECLDDWEAMADALAASATDDKQGQNPSPDLSCQKEKQTGSLTQLTSPHVNVGAQAVKGALGRNVVNTQAWRPDDAFRPQNLPNLSKQRSFPANLERRSCHSGLNPWVCNNVPSSCPICCEDLDLTDSSFLPCSCAFRLCLFCHKRILEDDGRCPGCRKPYSSDSNEKATSISGGSLTVWLARSCSMLSRV